jgi:hypothetical protein
MGFNVSVMKLVFVASTVNLLFNSNSTQPILTLTQIDTTSMPKARHLFEGGVYSSKMGKLGSVPVLRTRRLECLGNTIGTCNLNQLPFIYSIKIKTFGVQINTFCIQVNAFGIENKRVYISIIELGIQI